MVLRAVNTCKSEALAWVVQEHQQQTDLSLSSHPASQQRASWNS